MAAAAGLELENQRLNRGAVQALGGSRVVGNLVGEARRKTPSIVSGLNWPAMRPTTEAAAKLISSSYDARSLKYATSSPDQPPL